MGAYVIKYQHDDGTIIQVSMNFAEGLRQFFEGGDSNKR